MAETENLMATEAEAVAEPEKFALDPKKIAMYKVIIPLAVIFICTIVVVFMLNSAIKNAARIEGRFTLSQSGGSVYIDVDHDGNYTLSSNGTESKGILSMDGAKLEFISSDGEVLGANLIERKYIIFENAEFLKGEVPVGESAFDAEVVSDDGIAYGFRSNGSFYVAEDGRNTDLGSYITDGYFIVVTSNGTTTTYLNCGDGITSAFYQAS